MEFSSQEILEQLEKILKSKQFARVRKIIHPLRRCVLRALEPLSEVPNEYEVGTMFMDLPESFDQRSNTIVRVSFTRIRERLARYYATEGKDDPIVISFGRGYGPIFKRRGETPAPRVSVRLRPADVLTVVEQ